MTYWWLIGLHVAKGPLLFFRRAAGRFRFTALVLQVDCSSLSCLGVKNCKDSDYAARQISSSCARATRTLVRYKPVKRGWANFLLEACMSRSMLRGDSRGQPALGNGATL